MLLGSCLNFLQRLLMVVLRLDQGREIRDLWADVLAKCARPENRRYGA